MQFTASILTKIGLKYLSCTFSLTLLAPVWLPALLSASEWPVFFPSVGIIDNFIRIISYLYSTMTEMHWATAEGVVWTMFGPLYSRGRVNTRDTNYQMNNAKELPKMKNSCKLHNSVQKRWSAVQGY